MKLSEALNDALNIQVIAEYANSLRYLQIASFFEDLQLKNISSYFKKQAEHEKEHGNLFLDYINSRTGGKVSLSEIDAPRFLLVDYVDSGKLYVKFEEDTTFAIESLYDLAISEKSYVDLPFLQKMLDEQVEEEDKATEFEAKIKMVKDVVLFDATLEG